MENNCIRCVESLAIRLQHSEKVYNIVTTMVRQKIGIVSALVSSTAFKNQYDWLLGL